MLTLHHIYKLSTMPKERSRWEKKVIQQLIEQVHMPEKKKKKGVSIFTCPGFGWDRVNFHKKQVGLTQTSQSNGIFDIM